MKRPSILYWRALAILVPALIVGLVISFNTVQAEVPTAPPIFSDPLDFDNPFFPWAASRYHQGVLW